MPINRSYMPALHGLRGILSLWVFSLHLMLFLSLGLRINAEAFWGDFMSRIFWSGYLAVDAFFILSGFFISHVFLHQYNRIPSKKIVGQFLWERVARLYPVHLFTLVAYAFLLWGMSFPFSKTCFPVDPAIPCDPFSLSSFLKNLLLINAWGWFPQSSWNVNAWSISSEWAAYLAAPLLIILLRRINGGYVAITAAIAALLLMIMLLPLAERAQYFHNLFLTVLQRSGNMVGWNLFAATGPGVLEFGLIRLTAGFLCGCFMYTFFRSSLYGKIRWSAVALLSFAAVITIIQLLPLYWCYILFVPLILSTAQTRGIISTFLSSRVPTWFGHISYSLYMVHGITLKLFIIFLPHYIDTDTIQHFNPIDIVILLVLTTVLVFTVSAVVYYLIEDPCRKWLRNRSTPQNNATFIDRSCTVSS